MNIDIFDKFIKKNEWIQVNVICLEHLKLIVILRPKSTTAGFEIGTQDSD